MNFYRDGHPQSLRKIPLLYFLQLQYGQNMFQAMYYTHLPKKFVFCKIEHILYPQSHIFLRFLLFAKLVPRYILLVLLVFYYRIYSNTRHKFDLFLPKAINYLWSGKGDWQIVQTHRHASA